MSGPTSKAFLFARLFGVMSAVGFSNLATTQAWAQPQPPTQTQTTERTAKGQPGQDIRVGVFASIRSDCKSGPLPTIRLKEPPNHGKVTVKQGKLRTTNFRQCLAMEVPAFIVFYKSQPGFSGADTVTLEVVEASGKTQLQRITVTVGSKAGGQPI
jgi:hypothetical protein